MAGSVNKVILIGRLGRDPETRSFQGGGRVANLSVATSETWRDKTSGERKERTEWHRVVVFNDKLVEIVEKYLNKGSRVYVEGQIETRKWSDQSGAEKYVTEVVLRPFRGTIQILDGAREGRAERQEPRREKEDQPGTTRSMFPERSPLDDDIPF